MAEESPLFFKQLLSGVDLGKSDSSARQMANFIYIIGDKNTRECVIVDPAWDIDGILNVIETEEMKLKGSLVTHYHPDHVGGSIFGMNITGLAELMEKSSAPVYVNKHEAQGLKQVTGLSDSDLRLTDSEEVLSIGSIDITFLHTPGPVSYTHLTLPTILLV